MLDIKLNVTEMWKKTIIDKKIETNLVLKSDLSCDLSERRYSQKTERDALKTSFNLHVRFVLGAYKLHLKDSGKILKDPKEL